MPEGYSKGSKDVYDLVNEKGAGTATVAQAMDNAKAKTKRIKKDKIIARLKSRGE